MQCPVCKADNAQGPLCRRCKADLVLLIQLEATRKHHLAEALRCLSAGHWEDAVRLARRANDLRSDNESRRFVAIAALLVRTFEDAVRYYRTVDNISTLAKGKTG